MKLLTMPERHADITNTNKSIPHTTIPNPQDYGNLFGSNVLALPQRHKIGTTEFIHSDKVLNFIASDEKPIKCVYEGNALIIPGDLYKNQDLTQDYMYSDMHGLRLCLPNGNTGFGRFTITK